MSDELEKREGKKCPHCGFEVNEFLYCPQCGTPVSHSEKQHDGTNETNKEESGAGNDSVLNTQKKNSRKKIYIPILIAISILAVVAIVMLSQRCSNCHGSGHVECETCDNGTIECDSCENGKVTCGTCTGLKQITCELCDGTGKSVCTSCNGQGRIRDGEEKCSMCGGNRTITMTCRTCNGLGAVIQYNLKTVRCNTCQGSGSETTTCPICSGKGKVPHSIICTSCAGTGYSSGKCSECNGEKTVSCPDCQGQGVVDCLDCQGTGRRECPDCGGSNELQCPVCLGTGKKTAGGANTNESSITDTNDEDAAIIDNSQDAEEENEPKTEEKQDDPVIEKREINVLEALTDGKLVYKKTVDDEADEDRYTVFTLRIQAEDKLDVDEDHYERTSSFEGGRLSGIASNISYYYTISFDETKNAFSVYDGEELLFEVEVYDDAAVISSSSIQFKNIEGIYLRDEQTI